MKVRRSLLLAFVALWLSVEDARALTPLRTTPTGALVQPLGARDTTFVFVWTMLVRTSLSALAILGAGLVVSPFQNTGLSSAFVLGTTVSALFSPIASLGSFAFLENLWTSRGVTAFEWKGFGWSTLASIVAMVVMLPLVQYAGYSSVLPVAATLLVLPAIDLWLTDPFRSADR